MNVEIIEAYIIKFKPDQSPKGWSLHVYIPDWEMDIRGIKLIKTNSQWMCEYPHLKNYDADEEKIIGFPVISFSNSEKMDKFKKIIKEKSIEFIEQKLLTNNQNKTKF